MEDYVLTASLDERTTLYVSMLAPETFREHVEADNLGGADGYFVIRSTRKDGIECLDVLAKSPSFEAAGDLFDLIVCRKDLIRGNSPPGVVIY